MSKITVAVLSVGNRPHAKYCVSSFKDNIPESHFIQVTDLSTDKLVGVDEARRTATEEGMMINIIKGFANIDFEDILITTADDCILDGDLTKEMQGEFDVAIVYRHPWIEKRGNIKKKICHKFPYTNGLVIVKNKQFYKDCLNRLLEIKDKELDGKKYSDWWGDMACIKDVIESGKYTAKLLPESKYCKKPKHPCEYKAGIAKLWHYAGDERKKWMGEHENRSICV